MGAFGTFRTSGFDTPYWLSLQVHNNVNNFVLPYLLQEQPTDCGIKAVDVPEKIFPVGKQCESIDYFGAVATIVSSTW